MKFEAAGWWNDLDWLSGLDAAFLAAETDVMPLNVGAILVFDKGTQSDIESYDRVLRLFAARIHRFPHFRKKIVNAPWKLVQPYWVDYLSFSLSSHVHLAFADEEVELEKVFEFAASILRLRLDRSRPLWDLYVLPRVDGNRLAIIAKLHHAVTDGISGMEALAGLFDSAQNVDEDLRPKEHVPESPPSQFEVATRTFFGVAEHALSAISMGVSSAKELPHVVAGASNNDSVLEALGDMMPRPMRTGASRSISAERKVISQRLKVKDVVAVARSSGVKVNDVLLALSHAAVVAYLRAHGLDLPEALVAMVPISIQGEPGALDSKNKISAFFPTIPTSIADPIELLEKVHEITERAKVVHSGVGPMFFYNISQVVPPILVESVFNAVSKVELFRLVPPPFNYVVSNVPGPNLDLFLAGNRLEAVYPLAPVSDGSGMTFAYVSYRGYVFLGLTVDPSLFPFASEIPGFVSGILQELLESG